MLYKNVLGQQEVIRVYEVKEGECGWILKSKEEFIGERLEILGEV